MELEIKNKKLIIQHTNETYGQQLVVKRVNETSYQGQTRLSDVLFFHPAGFLYKEETGIGATTLELEAERNSIIVEPIKITASSKAKQYNALYVGSPTKYHVKRVSDKEIIAFVQNATIKNKKILVVADSLQRLVEAIGKDVFENYFLLIDEVDSFQLDSTYRNSMERCLEIYKKFKVENRAMVSATRIDFTDPELKKEAITYIKYDIPTIRDIHVVRAHIGNILPMAAEVISSHLKKYTIDKILVAYNSVSNCYNLASSIVKEKIINKEDIAILSSSSSQDRIKAYYKELDDDKLPCRLNFVTSAYFTGFDINEKFHLISISSNRTNYHALSDRRLKQIAGRSRFGLFSETIIHDVIPKEEEVKNVSSADLIKDANRQIESLKCLKKHFEKSPLLSKIYEDISAKLISALDSKGVKFIKTDEHKEAMISYLNIDAHLETLRIRYSLYKEADALIKRLVNDGHNVKIIKVAPTIEVEDQEITKQDREEKIEAVFNLLENLEISELEKEYAFGKYSLLQKQLMEDYINLHEYYGKHIIEKMKATLIGKRDSRAYNQLISSASMMTYPDTYMFNQRINHFFPIGKSFKPADILTRTNLFLAETLTGKTISTEKSAIRYIKTFKQMTRSKKGTDTVYKITGNNPYKLKVNKQKSNPEDN